MAGDSGSALPPSEGGVPQRGGRFETILLRGLPVEAR